jgi:hypothetical protein
MRYITRFLAIFLASAVVTCAYASDKLVCVLSDLRGNKFEYGFVKTANLSSSELIFKKNGVVAAHDAPPIWRIGWNELNFWLIPEETPDYAITVGKLRSLGPGSDLRGAEAILFRTVSGQRRLVSRGMCGTKYGTWTVTAAARETTAPPQTTDPQPTYLPSQTPLSQAATPSDAASVFMEGAGLPHQ